MSTAVIPSAEGLRWLRNAYPNLVYDREHQRIEGELDFRACYDAAHQKLRIEETGRDLRIRNARNYIQDVFDIEILLKADANGWPRVREVGGRTNAIGREQNVPRIDLHLFDDGYCCLGLRYTAPPRFRLPWFVRRRVVPFLYRLAYVNRFGLQAARQDLWGEYAHGPAGRDQYATEIEAIAARAPGRNGPCPCGRKRKYKRCCLEEVEAWKRRQPPRPSGPSAAVGGWAVRI